MKTAILLLFVVLLLTFGSYCLFFARNVQSYALRMIPAAPSFRSRWLKPFIESGSYLVNVRSVGVIAYIMATLLLLVIFRAK